MFSRIRLAPILGLGLAVTLFGCPNDPEGKIDPPKPLPIQSTSALKTANDNIRANVRGLARASAFLQSSDLFGPLLNDTTRPETEDPATLEAQADEMAAMIAEKILNETNIEIAEPTRIVLLLKAESICLRTVYDAESDEIREVLDDECAAQLEREPIRIALTSYRAGDIDADLLIGAAQARPIQLALHAQRIAVTMDLGASLQAAKILASLAGEVVEINGTVSGSIQLELIARGELDHEIALSIVTPIRIALDVEGAPIRFNAGASSPLMSVRFDGNAQKLISESHSGAIDLSLPLGALAAQDVVCTTDENGNTVCEEPAPAALDGILDIHVPAAHNRTEIDGSDTIRMTGVGYDDALRVKYDGIEILSVDLNANNGRRMDMELTGSDAGFLYTVRPLMDLVVNMDLSSLADEVELPSEFASESLRLRMDGDAAPQIRVVAPMVTDPPEPGAEPQPSGPTSIFEVVRGTFSLSSRALNRSVEVSAGNCLLVNEPASEDAHPVDFLASGPCNE